MAPYYVGPHVSAAGGPENAPLAALKGRLKAPSGRHLSVEEMHDVIRAAVLERLGGGDDRR